jgi:hypothetical protein
MAFNAINHPLKPLSEPIEQNYFNPIKQHLKKAINKPKISDLTPTPIRITPPNTEK